MSIILEVFKLDRPSLNDWVEFTQRNLRGKKEDGRSGDIDKDRGQFCTKASDGLSPYAPQATANRCYLSVETNPKT